MKSADRILGVIMGGLGILCFIEAYRIWVGWEGTGTMAVIVGAILTVLSIMFLVFPSRETKPIQWPRKKELVSIVFIGGTFALYNQFMSLLGYPISTWLFLAGVAKFIAPGRIHFVLIWTGAVAVGTYIIFKTFLNMYLPAGLLGF